MRQEALRTPAEKCPVQEIVGVSGIVGARSTLHGRPENGSALSQGFLELRRYYPCAALPYNRSNSVTGSSCAAALCSCLQA